MWWKSNHNDSKDMFTAECCYCKQIRVCVMYSQHDWAKVVHLWFLSVNTDLRLSADHYLPTPTHSNSHNPEHNAQTRNPWTTLSCQTGLLFWINNDMLNPKHWWKQHNWNWISQNICISWVNVYKRTKYPCTGHVIVHDSICNVGFKIQTVKRPLYFT